MPGKFSQQFQRWNRTAVRRWTLSRRLSKLWLHQLESSVESLSAKTVRNGLNFSGSLRTFQGRKNRIEWWWWKNLQNCARIAGVKQKQNFCSKRIGDRRKFPKSFKFVEILRQTWQLSTMPQLNIPVAQERRILALNQSSARSRSHFHHMQMICQLNTEIFKIEIFLYITSLMMVYPLSFAAFCF